MKKIIIGTVAVVLVLILSIPLLMGAKIERKVNSLLVAINQMAHDAGYSSSTQYHLTNYQRGWFSSTAELSLSVNLADLNPELANEIQIFNLGKAQIQHGLFLSGMRLGLAKITAQEDYLPLLEAAYGIKPSSIEGDAVVKIQLHINLNGSVNGQLELEKLKFKLNSVAGELAFADFQSQFHLTPEFKFHDVTFSLASLNINAPDMNIDLGHLRLGYEADQVSHLELLPRSLNLNLPKSLNLSVDAIDVIGLEDEEFVLKKLMITNNNHLIDHNLYSSLSIKLGEISASSRTFKNIKDIELVLALNHLNVKTLAELIDKSNKINHSNMREKTKKIAKLALWVQLPRLLDKNLELQAQKLQFSQAGETLRGYGLLMLNDKIHMSHLENPWMILEKIDFNLNIQAPKALTAKLLGLLGPEALPLWEEKRLIVADNKLFKLEMDYKGGKVFILNGREIDISDLPKSAYEEEEDDISEL